MNKDKYEEKKSADDINYVQYPAYKRVLHSFITKTLVNHC